MPRTKAKSKSSGGGAGREAFAKALKSKQKAWKDAEVNTDGGNNDWKPPVGEYDCSFIGLRYVEAKGVPCAIPKFRIDDGEFKMAIYTIEKQDDR